MTTRRRVWTVVAVLLVLAEVAAAPFANRNTHRLRS